MNWRWWWREGLTSAVSSNGMIDKAGGDPGASRGRGQGKRFKEIRIVSSVRSKMKTKIWHLGRKL